MTEKLLPCPFCGEDPKKDYATLSEVWTIHCNHEDCDVGCEVSDRNEYAVIEVWNTRAPQPPACAPQASDTHVPVARDWLRKVSADLNKMALPANSALGDYIFLLRDMMGDLAQKVTPSAAISAKPVADTALWDLFKDHYWDSFEADKEVLLKHISSVLSVYKAAAPTPSPDADAVIDRGEISNLICKEFGSCNCDGDEHGADTSKARCFKAADTILAALASSAPVEGPTRLALGDIVEMHPDSPYAAEWAGTTMKVVSLRVEPDGRRWVSVIEGSPRHRGNGFYDGETECIEEDHLQRVVVARKERGAP